jgi:glutamine---fructose-6-phosphate transaminase (isomerizing)
VSAVPDIERAAAASAMYREAESASAVVARQRIANAPGAVALGSALKLRPPRAVLTCARGSSDHAATYAKYLIETTIGVPTVSVAPSVSSVYGAEQDLSGCLYLAISQSGRSPDLLASVRAAAASGATVVALCNDPAAPLSELAHHLLPLGAGPERSVAATKSYIASLSALLQLVAAWTGDPALEAGVEALPSLLVAAWACDWDAALPVLTPARHLYVIGRGLGLAVAQEAALKCKETCGLHAEAFSGAEVRHGPMALLGPEFPALLLAQDDPTRPGLEALAAEFSRRGVPVLLAGGSSPAALELPTPVSAAAVGPILRIASIYRLLARLAAHRGLDPDDPPHLRKVTETV